MKTQLIILAVLAVCSVGVATAGDVTGLTTFTSGTKAVAAEVNDNFTAVKTAVDDNNSRITDNDAADSIAADELCTLYQLLSGTGMVGVLPLPAGCPDYTRTMFVTSTSYDGNLGGLAGADAKCQMHARTAGLTGTFKAWLSDSNASAISRLSHATTNYVTPNGDVIAADFAALVNTTNVDLTHAVDVDEFGNAVTGELAWTATTSTGNSAQPPADNCTGWTVTVAQGTGAVIGDVEQVNTLWTFGGATDCSSPRRLYCVQQ